MDIFANFFANFKSGILHKYKTIKVFSSRFVINILYLIWILGFINGFTFLNKYKLQISLKIINNQNIIRVLQLLSKKGKRIYVPVKILYKSQKKYTGVLILTTSKGLFTHYECIKNKISGEAILFIQ